MIISRTPFRISFAGGGSDFQEYYRHEPGAVVSSTIDKYMFLSMHPLFNSNGYHLKYSKNEIVDDLSQIQHPIIREVFSDYLISGVDFNSSSDVPSGTGLGSSSSFTTGLINLCNTYKNIYIKKENIAKEACEIEIGRLQSPIGKQDQYAAAVGGLNFIQFNPDESVNIDKIHLSEDVRKKLENSLLLFYTGDNRASSSILSEQKNNITKKYSTLKKMVTLAENMRDELKNDSIFNFGKILHESWIYKKELAVNITNSSIDHFYDTAMNNGAEGGKLLGAGASGFLLFFVPLHRQERIRKLLGLYELHFKFEYSGTTIIY